MSKVTKSRARRWGLLLVVIGGLMAPTGAARAQPRGREHARDHRNVDSPGRGRQEREEERRREEARAQEEARLREQARLDEEARARELARASWAIQQQALLAARDLARHQHAAELAASERARQQEAHRQAVMAARLRAQKKAFEHEEAELAWARERAERREAWLRTARERREARMDLDRRRRVWTTINRQAWVELRGAAWIPESPPWTGEHRAAVRAELRRHTLRLAYLTRMRQLAGQINEPDILDRIEVLFDREERVHQRRMDRLTIAVSVYAR